MLLQKNILAAISPVGFRVQDRKSTRLNSSHGYISYAVFCLKKKKTTTLRPLFSSTAHLSRARQLWDRRVRLLNIYSNTERSRAPNRTTVFIISALIFSRIA